MNFNKILITAFIIIILGALFFTLSFFQKENLNDSVREDNEKVVQIYYFWSISCPYCRTQNKFWEEFEEKYPEVKINKYSIDISRNIENFREVAKQFGAERHLGTVPATFVGDEYFIGFDNAQGIGKDIENAVLRELAKDGHTDDE